TAERISPSDRQRLIYKLIVGPVSEGYAGVNVEKEQWVDSIFPLHDHSFNKSWIKHWSSKWLIDRYDLRRIREHFGEELAMYFAFLQNYFLWLAIPAVIGLVWWLAGWSFSWQFGILLVLWSVLFTETWARRESDIATYWGVHGVQKVASLRRSDFHPDRYITDPASGETIPFFSNGKRWLRRLLSVPVVLALALLMALFVSLIFALQIFLDEYYDGPFNTLLGFTPIILFSACLPLYTSACRHIAKVLTDYENYEYEPEYAAQYTTKIFVFQFLQDQLYLILTAWVFVPQRDNFEMWLRSVYDTVSSLPAWMVPFLAQEPKKIMVQNLLTSFVITNQILNLLTETAIPLLLRWWGLRSLKKASSISKPATESIASVGSESGAMRFAAKVTEETRLPEYNTYEDYAEMASQFGRVTFFSVAWPLAPLAAFLNNWIELRTDAAKICGATKRPIPHRVDTIGPWLDTLRFMCWLSSITNALLIYQFHPNCSFLPKVADPEAMVRFGRTNLSYALVVLLFSEHMFLAIRWAITHAMASWPSAYARIVERSQAQSRRRWLERT
ncbi:calcium-activated chloride channel-domain-containing protein, partial [Coemansia spiralis]